MLDEMKRLFIPLTRYLPTLTLMKLIIRYAFMPSDYVLVELPLGLKVYLPKTEIISSLKNILHIFYYKDYEIFKDFVPKRGWLVIDVGAFIGLWSLRVSRLVSDSGRVIALEPNPFAYSMFLINLRLNGVKNVYPLPYALSSESGTLPLYISKHQINSSLCKEYVNLMGGFSKTVLVKTITLKDLLNSLSVNVVDLVKIDVEGHELKLVASLDRHIIRRIRRFIIEVHKEVADLSKLTKELEDKGYNVYVYEEYLPVQAFVYAKRF